MSVCSVISRAQLMTLLVQSTGDPGLKQKVLTPHEHLALGIFGRG